MYMHTYIHTHINITHLYLDTNVRILIYDDTRASKQLLRLACARVYTFVHLQGLSEKMRRKSDAELQEIIKSACARDLWLINTYERSSYSKTEEIHNDSQYNIYSRTICTNTNTTYTRIKRVYAHTGKIQPLWNDITLWSKKEKETSINPIYPSKNYRN